MTATKTIYTLRVGGMTGSESSVTAANWTEACCLALDLDYESGKYHAEHVGGKSSIWTVYRRVEGAMPRQYSKIGVVFHVRDNPAEITTWQPESAADLQGGF